MNPIERLPRRDIVCSSRLALQCGSTTNFGFWRGIAATTRAHKVKRRRGWSPLAWAMLYSLPRGHGRWWPRFVGMTKLLPSLTGSALTGQWWRPRTSSHSGQLWRPGVFISHAKVGRGKGRVLVRPPGRAAFAGLLPPWAAIAWGSDRAGPRWQWPVWRVGRGRGGCMVGPRDQ